MTQLPKPFGVAVVVTVLVVRSKLGEQKARRSMLFVTDPEKVKTIHAPEPAAPVHAYEARRPNTAVRICFVRNGNPQQAEATLIGITA